MDEEIHIKPKHRKLDKHFDITVNGKRVKILNYKISSYEDAIDKREYQTIELITKISNKNLNYKRVNIIIERENNIIEIAGIFRVSFSQPGLSRYQFRVNSYTEKNKDY